MQPAHILTSLFGGLPVSFLTLFIPSFLAGEVPGGGFYLHPITPLSFKSEDSNFVQNYFGVGSVFWARKVFIKSLMTSL